MDLADPTQRDAWRAYLGEIFAGKRVLCGPGVLAGFSQVVDLVRESGGHRPLVVATHRGAGPVPPPGAAEVVFTEQREFESATAELRTHDHLVRHLPDPVVERIERYDPDGEAVWFASPFVVNEPVLGRRVYNGRPAAWLALEDKLVAEQIWVETGIEHVPSRIVPVDAAAVVGAGAELDRGDGVVLAGDARDGFNGGANFVRWVVDDAERADALEFFGPRCDQVRVMPFLEGVPCSIHGVVLPDGTAVFRPVEIAMLRDVSRHRFVYGGIGSFWDPADTDRDTMRDVARRAGEWLRARVGYRGAFGVDGVVTRDGFRPTELNTRMSAGLTTLAAGVDSRMFTLLQANLTAGRDARVTVPELESVVPVMDTQRGGKPVALAERHIIDGSDDFAVDLAGGRLVRAGDGSGSRLVLSDAPTGAFTKVDPCAFLRPGDRLATANLALMRFLDAEYDAGFGDLTAAPDVRPAGTSGGGSAAAR
jgi:hypothetical protein